MEKNLPDFIADELIARIYVGVLKPGERLPAERQLAETLGVDRTSLRMALRTLSRMQLVRAVRGSGITVLDYRRHAGPDFLAAVLDIPELELGTTLKLEFVDTFNTIITGVIYQIVRGAIDAALVVELRDILNLQLKLLDSGPLTDLLLDQLAELDLRLQELLLYRRGGLIVELMTNATRPLRATVIRELFNLIDVRAYVDFHRNMIVEIGSGIIPVDQVARHYQDFTRQLMEPLRQRYLANPQQPRLRASPLQAALMRQTGQR